MPIVDAVLADYTGAIGRIDLESALRLSPTRYRWQAKSDGAYVRISTDRRGQISTALARSGLPLRGAQDLLGIDLGWPDLVVCGEHESCTEAGVRSATERGYSCVTLFDCGRSSGRSLAAEPYLARWGELHRVASWSDTEHRSRRDEWTTDDRGAAHAASGRYCRAIPRDWRRFAISPLHSDPWSLWREVDRSGGEGIVVVDLHASIGARGAKRKCKRHYPIDAVVVSVGRGAATLDWRGHLFVVAAGRRAPIVGETWEVQTDGFTAGPRVTPRHARLVRPRPDLSAI